MEISSDNSFHNIANSASSDEAKNTRNANYDPTGLAVDTSSGSKNKNNKSSKENKSSKNSKENRKSKDSENKKSKENKSSEENNNTEDNTSTSSVKDRTPATMSASRDETVDRMANMNINNESVQKPIDPSASAALNSPGAGLESPPDPSKSRLERKS
jgi:hypothetical protein